VNGTSFIVEAFFEAPDGHASATVPRYFDSEGEGRGEYVATIREVQEIPDFRCLDVVLLRRGWRISDLSSSERKERRLFWTGPPEELERWPKAPKVSEQEILGKHDTPGPPSGPLGAVATKLLATIARMAKSAGARPDTVASFQLLFDEGRRQARAAQALRGRR
jgi:hypothetical protein